MATATTDRFLGGRIVVEQPASGYRAGVDAVLLAAAVPALAGELVLELGIGTGVASLCLGTRVPELRLVGAEVQKEYAEFARRNTSRNGVVIDVRDADLRQLPDDLRAMSFDHVIANPPYFQREDGSASPDLGREEAMAGATPLRDWIEVATRRLGPKGRLTLIQDIRRLPEVLALLDSRLGDVTVLPFAPRAGRPAHRFVISTRKGSRAPFRLLAPRILHAGTEHEGDRENYTPEIKAVLREGAALLME